MQIEIIKLQIGTHAQLNFSTFETDASPTSVPCVDDGWLLHNSGQAHNSLFFCQSTSYLLLTNVTGFPGELDPLPSAMLSITSVMLTATCHFCLLCLWEMLLICLVAGQLITCHCSFLSNRNDWFLLSPITLIALKYILYTLDLLLFIY